jgi:hypothetical protein
MSQIVLRLRSAVDCGLLAVDHGLSTIDYPIDSQFINLICKFLNHKLA